MALLTVFHILAAILLIVLVLIQDSKGAMGGSFGGGGATNSILGPTGAPHFLFKLTRYVVVIFAITSLLLSKFSSESDESALDRVSLPAATAPATAPAPEVPAAVPAQTPAPTGN